MGQTSLSIDDHLIRQLEQVAKARRTSTASVVREAVVQYLAAPKRLMLPAIAGQFASGATDTSERVDELLWANPHE
ncbi:MAG: ribbon-helix-helix domain-containing protein [Nevskiaceae bacterium]|jgi:predicted transcriptional regulator|nr:ribbon-helix-helix domain-containing protein [Nevskiaceae bacterium]